MNQQHKHHFSGRAWIVVGFFLTLGVSADDVVAQVISPGELSRAHRALEGGDNCTKCHEPRGRVSGSRCLSCHKALKKQVSQRKGYHANLANSRCGKCHQDHRGRNFQMIRWPGGKEAFNHDRTGYPLRDAHKKPKCVACHQPSFQKEAVVKKFDTARRNRTFLGLSTNCINCHADDDEHKGRLGKKCARCHDEATFKKASQFNHDNSDFPLRGAHKKSTCDDCHRESSRTPERLFKGIDFAQCTSCHKDPHRGVMSKAVRGQPAKKCEACHKETDWKQLVYARRKHAVLRMPLVGGHAKPKCTQCHKEKATLIPSRACSNCHRDPHARRFGNQCETCHSVRSWHAKPTTIRAVPQVELAAAERLGIPARAVAKVGFHNKTRFPLRGLHIKVACKNCHKPARRGYKRRFRGLKFNRCSDCHQDSHAGTFAKQVCEDCHQEAGWSLTTYDVDRHQESKYPLEGSHRSVACIRCHTKTRSPATRFKYATTECGGCHQDIHQGQFVSGGDSKTCKECHTPQTFTPSTFNHDTTQLPLKQAHAATACGSCHLAQNVANQPVSATTQSASAKTIQYRGLSSKCFTCHRDDHQGQFSRRGPSRPCTDCHSQANFAIDDFAHQQVTGEPLTGGHAVVECSQCHQKVQLVNGDRVVLYRLVDKKCASCHADQHQDRANKLRQARNFRLLSSSAPNQLGECESCHEIASWQQLSRVNTFNHTTVGYPLRGQHSTASCADCHQPRMRQAKRLTRECSGCHQDRHQGRLGSACANCHDPKSWRSTKIREKHRNTRLPLTGGHALADCTSCHPRARQGQYVAVPTACVGCHASDYQAPETHPDHRSSGFGTECEQCHRPRGWSPAFFAHTTFALRGAHRATDCNNCHDKNPTPRDCLSCHTSERGRANFPNHNANGFPTACEQCHNERAWLPANFAEHESYFPIARGKHSGFGCTECHSNPNDARQFTCLAPCHTRNKMDDKHDDISGYLYESRACLNCHPRGRE